MHSCFRLALNDSGESRTLTAVNLRGAIRLIALSYSQPLCLSNAINYDRH